MKLTYLSVAIATIFASSAWAGNGNSPRNNSQNAPAEQGTAVECLQLGTCDTSIALSNSEILTLSFMREEEKMARDVYITLYDVWNSPLFDNISQAEQQHMDQLKLLLDSYGLPDPALEEVGIFTDTTIQSLYDSLVERGSISLIEALHVGGLVEEVDIADLRQGIAETENPLLNQVYTNLLKGSYQHLRAFIRNIESSAALYEAQFLSQAEVDEIVNLANISTGVSSQGGNSELTANNAQFQAVIQTQTGLHANGSVLNQNDTINLTVMIQADPDHVGETVDFIIVATLINQQNQALMFMRDDTSTWHIWDAAMNTLIAAEAQQELYNDYQLDIYEGLLPAGRYDIAVGYRLQDGTVIFNTQVITFSVQ